MSKTIYNQWGRLLLAAMTLGGAGAATCAWADGAATAPASTEISLGSARALAQSMSDGNGLGFTSPALSYLTSDGSAKEATVSFSEVLRGNGTRAGYVLTHGGVVPRTLRVSVGARVLKYNTDYYADCASGALYFTDPVRKLDTVTATYQYVASQDTNRTPSSISGLALKLNGTSLGFSFGMSAAGNSGVDLNTYGMSLNSKVGTNSLLNGLVYFSAPTASNTNLALDQKAGVATARAAATAATSGNLISQSLNAKSGNMSLSATYQNVSAGFNGFAAMRQANSGNADALKQIGVLEKEKGINRLGLGMGMAMGKSGALNLNWNQVGDGSGQIQSSGFDLKSGKFNMAYDTRSVGQTFSRFSNLSDANAAQLAKEIGLSRSNLTMGLAMSKNSSIAFSQLTFGNSAGDLARQSVDFNDKNFKFTMTDRSAGSGFSRLSSLSDVDASALALDVRRQYDATATATQVTAADKAAIALDAGLRRQQMMASTTVGKGTGISFNEMEISDASGGVSRRTLGLTGRNFSFTYLDQNISSGFTRLSSMSAFERGQLGNEYGLQRSSMILALNLAKNTSLTLSQLGLGDRNSGMLRQSMEFKGRGVDAQLNLAQTDQSFTRAADLAGLKDSEKSQIELERGFTRMDFHGSLTSIKGLSLSTYTYSARNTLEDLLRGEYRHNLAWNANKVTKVSYLAEGNNYDEGGQVKDSSQHDLLTLNTALRPGMTLNMYRDTLASASNFKQLATVVTDFLHFETDRSKSTNYMLETKRTDYGDSRFENITQLDMRHRVSKAFSFHFNKETVDRGKELSSDADTMEWAYQLSKGLAFGGSFGQTAVSNQADITSQSYSLSGALTRQLNFGAAYTEVAQPGTNTRAVKDFSISNAKPMNTLGMKQVTLTAKYASTTDQHTLQNESVAGKVQGMLGANTLSLEYAGNADPKDNSSVTRAFSFVSDRNVKLPLHFDLTYKANNVNRSDVLLTRLYNATYKMDKLTNLVYNYTAQPDTANTTVMSKRASKLSLTRTLNSQLSLAVDYTTLFYVTQLQNTDHFGGRVSGRIDKLSTVEVGYDTDFNTVSGANVNSHTIRLSYDRQVNTDHYVSVSTTYVMNFNGTPDEMRGTLDLKSLF